MAAGLPETGARVESLWPERIRELTARWLASDSGRSETQLAELWTLLNLALQRYARGLARRFGPVSRDDVVDIAADKALDLLRRMQEGLWDPGAWSRAQMTAFLFSVARNGVVDLARRRGREVPAALGETGGSAPTVAAETGADQSIDGGRYARAIVECARGLPERARLAWVLRAFHELSSAAIGRHPDVQASPAAVDLMLNRSRGRLRQCLRSKGFEPAEMPPGTFIALWEIIEAARRRSASQGEGMRQT